MLRPGDSSLIAKFAAHIAVALLCGALASAAAFMLDVNNVIVALKLKRNPLFINMECFAVPILSTCCKICSRVNYVVHVALSY